MNPVVKNIIAVVLGVVIGSAVNMGIVMISGSIIPPPDGVDATTMEGLKAGIHLFQPEHFIFPFIAHALGTFIGALLAFMIAATNKMKFALVIGGLFLIGGILNTFMLPAPTWFIVLDLILAYIPVAWIAGNIASHFKKN